MSTAIGAGGAVVPIIKQVIVSKVIDASIGAYTALDVVNDDDCSTTATAWNFANIVRANGRSGTIINATLFSESENITPRFTLRLYNASPASELTDNSPSSNVLADRLLYVGQIDFPSTESLCTTSDAAITLASPSTVGGLPQAFTCASADVDLYGILLTRDAFTQTNTDDITIVLLVEMY